jgi:Metallo-peptidase family M12B Reprolysin-like/Ig-like domain CHU_C associated
LKTRTFTLILLATALTSFSQTVKPFKFKLSTSDYQNRLKNTPIGKDINAMSSLAELSNTTIKLPLPNGSLKTFKVIGSEVMGEKLASNFPGIRSYKLFGQNKKDNISGALTVSESGLHAILFTDQGEVVINTDKAFGTEYSSGYQDLNDLAESCGVDAQHLSKLKKNPNARKSSVAINSGTQIRTYRIAIITTGEFYANNGGTIASAQTAVISIINSLKAVYERELSVSFNLVATKIYTDAATDPFNGNNATTAANAFGVLAGSDPTNFAVANYDLGQVLNYAIGGGGVAFLNSVCNNYNIGTGLSPVKGGGFSGCTVNNISSLVHEVGHQFGAGHTFNSVSGGCASGNIMNDYAVEPGSGSTFMSYFSACAPDNLNNTIGRAYFHSTCIEDMLYFIQNSTKCNTSVTNTNHPPMANAMGNKIVPKGTPFKLTGSGTDADGNMLYYNWEQIDAAPQSFAIRGGADEAQHSLYSPLFRSVEPTSTGNMRSFPALNQILNFENVANNDEALAQVARTINMRFVARDNVTGGGGLDYQDMVLTIDNSGPFLLTSQNIPNIWLVGDKKTITWSVNNTDVAPLNVSTINILMSTDGGLTFPTILASNTPNDGNHIVTVPATISNTVRIKIEPSSTSHIFFDINNANINIVNTFTCAGETSTIAPSYSLATTLGSRDLNLNMYAFKPVTSFTVTTESTDPSLILTGLKAGVCASPYSNSPNFKTISFRVTGNDTYAFTKSVSTGSFNIYKNSFDPAYPCNNWVGTSLDFTNITSSAPVNIQLLADTSYIMVVSPGLSTAAVGTMTINVSSVSKLVLCLPFKNTYYDYGFVITNSKNNVVSIQEKADLTDALKFTSDTYTITGLSYTAGVDFTEYIGKPLSVLQNSFISTPNCGVLSSNSRFVSINCSETNKIAALDAVTCSSSPASLSISGCSGTYNWYDTQSGGVILTSNKNLVTPVLKTSKIYYVECLSNPCSLGRTAVSVTVSDPVAPTISSSNIVSGSAAVLTAIGCVNGSVNWYDIPTGGLPVGAGQTFTTSMLTFPLESKTYYASCQIGSCESEARTAIIVSICNNQNLSLSAPINITGQITNKTDGKITATNKINPVNGTAVTYASKSSITFEPGFEVSSVNGSSFKTALQGCLN